tara:strand:+ start:308 stop:601 length:294 start_codon:yes stop_codon:yes gene_type:complete
MSNIRGYYSIRQLFNTAQRAAMRRQFPLKIKISRDIVESVIDVGSGFFLAIIIQITVFPFFDLHPSIFENFQIALIFTIVSMTRSAIWRRYFRKRQK